MPGQVGKERGPATVGQGENARGLEKHADRNPTLENDRERGPAQARPFFFMNPISKLTVKIENAERHQDIRR